MISMITSSSGAVSERMTRTLDAVEERLPTVPRLLLQLNRSMASLGCRMVSRATDAATESGESITSRATAGARTVQGQARSATERTVATGTRAAKEVVGQARAQSEQVIDTIDSEATTLADDAVEATEQAERGSYQGWTKAELYDRAQELDVSGRSSMSKGELIDAIIAAT